MMKHGFASVASMSALLFLVAAVSASDSRSDSAPAAPAAGARAAVAAPAFPPAAPPVASSPAGPAQTAVREAPARTSPEKARDAREPRESLGDAVITQNLLRVFLGRPATVTVHNAQGRQIFLLESPRPMEVLPLAGVPTGFLYLTLRAGPLELTKKLVHSGK